MKKLTLKEAKNRIAELDAMLVNTQRDLLSARTSLEYHTRKHTEVSVLRQEAEQQVDRLKQELELRKVCNSGIIADYDAKLAARDANLDRLAAALNKAEAQRDAYKCMVQHLKGVVNLLLQVGE